MEAHRLERLRWRCRRGMLELDLMLEEFLQQRYLTLSTDEQGTFERLLSLPDNQLLAYLQGQTIPEKEFEQIVGKIRQ